LFVFRYGQTPLHLAVLSGDINAVEAVTHVISQMDSSQMTVCDENGNTALHLAAIQQNSVEMMKLLSATDAATTNRFGDTPFHLAARSGHDTSVEQMLLVLHGHGKKFNIDTSNWRTGDTALHISVRRGDLHRVEQLVKAGADLAAKNNAGNTALHVIVEECASNPTTIDIYLQVNADSYLLEHHVLTKLSH
jgi:ankyrin repeat protein